MTIHFEVKGNKNKPCIVFVHGGGMSGWMWNKQVEYFSDYYCIVPDLPEHGKSLNNRLISLGDCADQVANLIEKETIHQKAHVIGHSLGGKVVVELLSKRPDLVDHAIVASALFRPMFLLKLIHQPFIYQMSAAMLKNKYMLELTAKQFKFPEHNDLENLMLDFKKLTPGSLYRIYDQLHLYNTIPTELNHVSAPTLVIAGGKEIKAMKQSVIELAGVLPNSKALFVKNENHAYPWRAFEIFNKIIRLWITDGNIEKELEKHE